MTPEQIAELYIQAAEVDRRRKPVCSISGCDHPAHGKGLCRSHYMRQWRHGDPNKIVNVNRGKLLPFVHNVAMKHQGPHCLLWPFKVGKNGYACVTIDNKTIGAHHYVCELANGPRPSDEHEAAHSCGKRNCISPNHLRWATTKENAADRAIHGTQPKGQMVHGSKLTPIQVIEIKNSRYRISERKLASIYGVRRETIRDIYRGKSWSWVNG